MITTLPERSAVAALRAPTVPLSTLVEALAVLRAVRELRAGDVVPVNVLVDALIAKTRLGFYVDQMLAAQHVGVTE